MADSIRASLPPIYTHLLNAFFDRAKVEERRATCDNCSMCNQGEPSPVPMEFFEPSTKCCTFWPNLPNYLVGAILADESPDLAEGKRRVRQVIQSRIGVRPMWVERPRKWTILMQNYHDAFGRAKSLRCPYFNLENVEAACTIWKHREMICHTYYCRYSGGMRGFEYWSALKQYLSFVQAMLARGAMTAIDPSLIEPQLKDNVPTPEDIDDLPPKNYDAWWGAWAGREEEFYLRCHEWVEKLSPAAFNKTVDQSKDGQRLLSDVIAKYDAQESKLLPARLVRNARMREQHVGDKVVITSYHRYDPFAIDKDLFEVVGQLKPEETLAENLERMQRDEGVELAPELVEFLYAAGVLIEPGKKVDGSP